MLFIDFLLDKEGGQKILSEANYIPAHPEVPIAYEELRPESSKFEASLPFLQEVDKSLRAVKAVVDYSHNSSLGNEKGISYDSQLERKKPVEAMIQNAEAAESGDLITLNEVDSKQILKQYGIPILRHMISGSAPEAVEAADTIGYPVVLRNNGERNCRVLVEPFMSKGQEVVLGVHRDPEMGLVMMFGSGVIWLELFKDVAFHEIPFTRYKQWK